MSNNLDRRKELGKRLKEAIERSGLNQRQIAERLNISENSLSNYVTGKRTPDALLIKDITELIDADLFRLLMIDQDVLREVVHAYQNAESAMPEGADVLRVAEKLKKEISKVQVELQKRLDRAGSTEQALLERAEIALGRADIELERMHLEIQKEIWTLGQLTKTVRANLDTVYKLLSDIAPPSG